MSAAAPTEADRRPRLYVVVLSHLDTQWRWTVRDTARHFLPATVAANEDRFRRFPSYRLSFEGAHRYRLLDECHPDCLETVRLRVAEGRWFPCGAAWEAFDANLTSPESIVRQILLGRRELERTTGRASDDLFLPDCFGFPRSLPSVAAHCGVVGFTTQKLRRGTEMRAAFGIPFPLGRWRGPDGGEILAALDPGEYGAQATADLSRDPEWTERLAGQIAAGLPAKLPTFQGLGDKGGAIAPEAVDWLERAAAPLAPGDGRLDVQIATSEAIFRDLSASEKDSLPVHDGDLLLRLHATGCYSSRSQLKRWHRAAESLGAIAERAAALADPHLQAADRESLRARLRGAWERVLSHQMHDDLTGTSLPEAYRFSADDLAASLLDFSAVLSDALGAAVPNQPGTADDGDRPLAVLDAGSVSRSDLVELRVDTDDSRPPRIADAALADLPTQWRRVEGRWIGCARVPTQPLSVRSLVLRRETEEAPRAPVADEPATLPLRLTSRRFAFEIDGNGDVSRWTDLASREELLAAPAGVELLANRSERFPSWEIRYEDTSRPPRSRLAGPVRARWIERGPLRTRLRIEQEREGSTWRRDYVLDAEGDWLEVDVRVDWRTDATLAKATFPFAWEFDDAVYDLGAGVAPRGIASSTLYEVPAQDWAAAPMRGRAGGDESGGGAVVLSDVKQGWDHPDARTLRLTLLHTPAIGRRFRYQRRQDFGVQRFRWALARVANWGEATALAERFRRPPLAFELPRASGSAAGAAPAPRDVSVPIRLDGATVMALKPAEDGAGAVLRVRETRGTGGSVRLGDGGAFRLGAELDGGERPIGAAPKAPAAEGSRISLSPFALRTFELLPDRLAEESLSAPGAAVELVRDAFAVTDRGERSRDGGLGSRGAALPRRLLPRTLRIAGATLDLEPLHRPGAPSATRASGQTIRLPRSGRRAVLLIGAFGERVDAAFRIAESVIEAALPDSLAPLGRFDEVDDRWAVVRGVRVRAGQFVHAPLALRVPHLHDRRGRIDPCRPAALFAVELSLPAGATVLHLPAAPALLLFAATVTSLETTRARPLAPLFTAERDPD